jgi:hypothetical protein
MYLVWSVEVWQVTRDPAYTTAVNSVAKTIRRITSRIALERWETEVRTQSLLPIAKSIMKRHGPKTPTAVHGNSGITYHLNEKAKVIADCLENQFTSHDLCDDKHERRVEKGVQAQLASVDDTPLGKVKTL